MGRPKQVSNEQILMAARRCFLERGVGVSALEIAAELGVSHTTIFNRFGSKEALMIAALAPAETVNWTTAMSKGPDARPLRDQLIQHAQVIASYFNELQLSLAVLQAAGIPAEKIWAKVGEESPPAQAFRALTNWLKIAQDQGRLAACDVEALAATILGALHHRVFEAEVCGASMRHISTPDYVERFVDLIWNGVGK